MSNDLNRKRPLIKRIFADNSYCWLAAACTAAVMMLVYFCYNLFPFGEVTILRMDLYHQYGPLFAEFYDRVMNLRSFIYSWTTGLGSPFLGNYFNYLSSPSSIIILLLGHQNMPESIAGMILVKAALSAASFTYYLKKSRGRSDFSTAAFGVLYSMCGYFVAYYWNVMWIDAMVYFPLVVYGVERIINRRKPSVYIAFLALTLLSNYYMGYMTCIFSVIYFIVYFISTKNFTDLADNTVYYRDGAGNKKYKITEWIKGSVAVRSAVTFALGSLAAGLLVAFSLIPVFYILRSCSATSGSWPQNYRIYFSVFDFLANHLASVDPTIRSSGDDVLPNVYCGMVTLILMPLYIFSKRISLKEKIASVFTLGIIYFSFNINFLNYIWHGFHFPNDLPYRFSFMYCFLLLSMAYKAFTNLSEYTGRQLLGSSVAIIFAIILVQEIGSKNVQDITVLLSVIFVVTYTLILYLLKDEKKQQSAIAVVILCCVIAELACSNTDRYSMSQTKTTYASDYSQFKPLKERLDEREGNDTYRMEITYNRARMDPAWYGYNGVSTFTSMAYEKMANMQSNLGVYGNYINSYTYYLQTPVYNMMNSLKYIVDNDEDVTVEDDYYTKVDSEGKFTAYENKYYLPIAMTAGKQLEDWYSAYTNPFLVQGEWFEFATGVPDVFGRMDISDIRYYNIEEIDSGLDTGDIYFNRVGNEDGDLTLVLTTEETHHCYLFVDSDYFEDITITRGERSVNKSIDEPYIYDLGIVTPDETVEVLINVTADKSNYCFMNFYPYYVNDEALDEGYEILKKNAMKVESFDDTRIKGTVNAAEDSMVFTSIPYDKGWSVKVDGEQLSPDKIIALGDAYLTFNVEKGEHSVEFSFEQRGLKMGACISLATLLLIILLSFIIGKRRPVYDEKVAAKNEKAEEEYLEEKHRRELEDERQRLMAHIPSETDISEMELFAGMTSAGEDAAQDEEPAGEDAAEDSAEETVSDSADEESPTDDGESSAETQEPAPEEAGETAEETAGETAEADTEEPGSGPAADEEEQ